MWTEILLLNTGPGQLKQERQLATGCRTAKHRQRAQAQVGRELERRGDEARQ